MVNKKTYQLALGGICLALTIVFMFGAVLVPGVELTLYAVSSLFVAVMMIESGFKGGAGLYISAVLLGLLIVPDKVGMLPYICVFGIYGIIKFYIEKISNPVIQILLKLVFFTMVLIAAFTVFKSLLLGNVNIPNMPVWVLIGAGVLFLLLYDFIYTLLIRIYCRRFKKTEKIHFVLSEAKEEAEKNDKYQ